MCRSLTPVNTSGCAVVSAPISLPGEEESSALRKSQTVNIPEAGVRLGDFRGAFNAGTRHSREGTSLAFARFPGSVFRCPSRYPWGPFRRAGSVS